MQPCEGCFTPALCRAKGCYHVTSKENPTPKVEGRKDDAGKARHDLLPPEALDAVARVMAMGAAKYGERNWEAGMCWGRVYAAMQRHSNAWLGGEEHDPVDGQHHLDSVIWCAMVLRTYVARGIGTDDRKPT